MSFVSDIVEDTFGSGGGGWFRHLFDPGDLLGTGKQDALEEAERQQQDALSQAMDEYRRATEEAQGYYQPYADVGQAGVDNANFLTDADAQYDWLQNNPLFQMGLDNANQATSKMAAARGRLSAGDTLLDFNNNALLAAQPLITQRMGNISNLLNYGADMSRSQANAALGLGSQLSNAHQQLGNIQAAGTIGQQQAISQGIQNTAGIIGSFFLPGAGAALGAVGSASGGSGGGFAGSRFAMSDSRLKDNVTPAGSQNGYNLYEWDWNEEASKLGLSGKSKGVLATEVLSKKPEAISFEQGYMKVDYGMIGVNP